MSYLQVKNKNMKPENLSELSERELENKEKLIKTSFYFITIVGIICTLTVIVSSYISEQQTSWLTWTFVTFLPLYMAFKAKKELNEIKAEFERRRYR